MSRKESIQNLKNWDSFSLQASWLAASQLKWLCQRIYQIRGCSSVADTFCLVRQICVCYSCHQTHTHTKKSFWQYTRYLYMISEKDVVFIWSKYFLYHSNICQREIQTSVLQAAGYCVFCFWKLTLSCLSFLLYFTLGQSLGFNMCWGFCMRQLHEWVSTLLLSLCVRQAWNLDAASYFIIYACGGCVC